MKELLLKRTKGLALTIFKLVASIPYSNISAVLIKQIIRSGTSVGANYRATCRAKSRPDFINKLKIVEEELDETIYWLELIQEAKLLQPELISPVKREAIELLSIFVSTIKTARINS